jgi:hypothetical protein
MPAKAKCAGVTHLGVACRKNELPGFGYCLRHLPEELCDEAEKLGYRRCKHAVNDNANPRHGMRCANEAINDGQYCAFHQPQDKWIVPQTYEQRRAMVRLSKAAGEAGIDTSKVANPLQALMEVAAEEMAFKDELAMRVVALEKNEWRYENIAGEQIRGDIILYERALDRVTRSLTVLTKLGIEERLTKVTERQARIVEQAVVRAIEEIGLSPEMQDKAREAVGKHLRAAA